MRGRQLLHLLLVIVVLTATVVGGVMVGLAAGGSTDERTSFATVRTSVQVARHGHIAVFVPLVDWKLDVLDHHAPVTITLEIRGIDRTRAQASISSAQSASQSLDDARRDATVVVRAAAKRGVLAAASGGIVGGLIGGALLSGILLRRRWLVVGPAVGLLGAAMLIVPSVHALQRINPSEVRANPEGGHAQELPYILQFSRQLLHVGDGYETHFRTALDSVGNLVSFAQGTAPATSKRGAARSMYLMSDLHDNVFVLDAFDRFTGNDVVFAGGDFGQVGARVEQQTAPRIAKLGRRVVAVSGNHDSTSYMRALTRAGATVLDDESAIVDRLRVSGYSDPLESKSVDDGSHVLSVRGAAYTKQVDDFIAWFDALDTWPDVVLVHQHGFALRLARELVRRHNTRPLTLLVGHDHVPKVERVGRAILVDGGTLGAGGPFAIGSQSASFAKLNFRGNTLVSVDIVSVDPLTGDASAKRTVVGEVGRRTRHAG